MSDKPESTPTAKPPVPEVKLPSGWLKKDIECAQARLREWYGHA